MKINSAKLKKQTMVGSIGLRRYLTTTGADDKQQVSSMDIDRDLLMVIIRLKPESNPVGVPIADFDFIEFAPVITKNLKAVG